MPNDRIVITIPEAASQLGLSPQAMYRMVREQILPGNLVVRLGRRKIRIKRRALEEWIEQGGGVK